MSDYVKLASGAADQYLTALAETQEQFLKSVTAFNSWMPKMPSVSTPSFGVELPTAKEMVEANFAFATKLLKQQKDFAEKLVAVSTPAS